MNNKGGRNNKWCESKTTRLTFKYQLGKTKHLNKFQKSTEGKNKLNLIRDFRKRVYISKPVISILIILNENEKCFR